MSESKWARGQWDGLCQPLSWRGEGSSTQGRGENDISPLLLETSMKSRNSKELINLEQNWGWKCINKKLIMKILHSDVTWPQGAQTLPTAPARTAPGLRCLDFHSRWLGAVPGYSRRVCVHTGVCVGAWLGVPACVGRSGDLFIFCKRALGASNAVEQWRCGVNAIQNCIRCSMFSVLKFQKMANAVLASLLTGIQESKGQKEIHGARSCRMAPSHVRGEVKSKTFVCGHYQLRKAWGSDFIPYWV